jgi:hypothetical protein
MFQIDYDKEIENAKKHAFLNDRKIYLSTIAKIFETMGDTFYIYNIKYSFNKLQLIYDDLPMKLLTTNSLITGTNITNQLFKDGFENTRMLTIVPRKEFSIRVNGRQLFTVITMPFLGKGPISNYLPHYDKKIAFDGVSIPVKVLSNELYLIEYYHTLYSPYPENWDLLIGNVNGGNADKITVKLASIDIKMTSDGKEDMFNLLGELPELGVLIGIWAMYKLGKIDQKPFKNKLQIISDISPEKIAEYLNTISNGEISYQEKRLNMIDDYWLKLYAFYINGKVFMDVFNSTTYEIIPYINSGNYKIGNKFVLLRFFHIDFIIIKLLESLDILNKYTAEKIHDEIKTMINLVNGSDEKIGDELFEFGSQYTGNFVSTKELKKKLVSDLFQEQRFPPYVPFYRNELRVFDH